VFVFGFLEAVEDQLNGVFGLLRLSALAKSFELVEISLVDLLEFLEVRIAASARFDDVVGEVSREKFQRRSHDILFGRVHKRHEALVVGRVGETVIGVDTQNQRQQLYAFVAVVVNVFK
jgi:hypothetical protein